jgi:hypothetical protein
LKPNKLTKALEQVIYSAHIHKDTQPSVSILILPDWKRTPYLTRNPHNNYIKKVATLPHTHNNNRHSPHKIQPNIYLVAKSKALTLL